MDAQRTKFIAGIALVVGCGLAILRWFFVSLNSETIWDASPVWLILTPFLFFVGLWLLSASHEEEWDAGLAKGIRKRMILIYLGVTLGLAVVFVLIHVLLHRAPSAPGKSYAALIIFFALVSYAICYWKFIRKAGYRDRTPLLLPFFFLSGAIMTPLFAVDIFNSVLLGNSMEAGLENKLISYTALALVFWLLSSGTLDRKGY